MDLGIGVVTIGLLRIGVTREVTVVIAVDTFAQSHTTDSRSAAMTDRAVGAPESVCACPSRIDVAAAVGDRGELDVADTRDGLTPRGAERDESARSAAHESSAAHVRLDGLLDAATERILLYEPAPSRGRRRTTNREMTPRSLDRRQGRFQAWKTR